MRRQHLPLRESSTFEPWPQPFLLSLYETRIEVYAESSVAAVQTVCCGLRSTSRDVRYWASIVLRQGSKTRLIPNSHQTSELPLYMSPKIYNLLKTLFLDYRQDEAPQRHHARAGGILEQHCYSTLCDPIPCLGATRSLLSSHIKYWLCIWTCRIFKDQSLLSTSTRGWIRVGLGWYVLHRQEQLSRALGKPLTRCFDGTRKLQFAMRIWQMSLLMITCPLQGPHFPIVGGLKEAGRCKSWLHLRKWSSSLGNGRNLAAVDRIIPCPFWYRKLRQLTFLCSKTARMCSGGASRKECHGRHDGKQHGRKI